MKVDEDENEVSQTESWPIRRSNKCFWREDGDGDSTMTTCTNPSFRKKRQELR